MIHYKFPPIKSIGAIRNYNIAEQFVKNGFDVSVLTTSNVEVMPTEDLPNHPFVKYSIFTIDYKTIWHRLFKKKKQNLFSEATKSFPFFYRLKNSFPFNLFLDEGGLVYIYNAVRQAKKLIKSGEVDIIYSSFRPYSDHFVGYLLKKSHPDIKWIADFRDPPFDPARKQVVLSGIQKWLGKQIMKKADVNLTVSKGVATFLELNFGQQPLVVRNSINPLFHIDKPSDRYDKFTIAYTGSITADLQTAAALFKGFKDLFDNGILNRSQVQVVYAGKDGGIWNRWISQFELHDINVNMGVQTMKEVLSIQKKSHINLLLTWSGPIIKGILTGKQNEYFAAERPVLAIVNGEKDEEIEEIYQELNAGYVYSTQDSSSDSLKNKLIDWYEEWEKEGKVSIQFNKEKLKEHTWAYQFCILKDYMKRNNWN